MKHCVVSVVDCFVHFVYVMLPRDHATSVLFRPVQL